MDLQIKVEDKYILIYLAGPIDAKSAIEIEDELERIVFFHSDKDIILNLKDVKYMSSSGLRIFIALKNNLIDTNQKLKLCAPQDNVSKIFEITRVAELFEIYTSEEEAIQSFSL
jgi:anti-sigma B factor antagonist